MIRGPIVALIWALLFPSLVAEADSLPSGTTVSAPIQFQVGDKAKIIVEKSRADPQTKKLGFTPVGRTTYLMEIVGRTDTELHITWTPQAFEIKHVPPALKKMMVEQQLKAFSSLIIDYDADLAARPIRLRNFDGMLEKSLSLLRADGTDQRTIALTRKMVTGLTEPQKTVTFLKEPYLFSMWSGFEANVGEVVSHDTQVPSPFGNDQWPAQQTTVLEKVTAGNDALITWNIAMDPDETKKRMTAVLEGMARQAGRSIEEVPDEVRTARLTTEGSGQARISIADGWTRYLRYERATVFGPKYRKDKTEIFVQRLE